MPRTPDDNSSSRARGLIELLIVVGVFAGVTVSWTAFMEPRLASVAMAPGEADPHDRPLAAPDRAPIR